MDIWVDSDACLGAVKEILYRAAQLVGVPLTLVANQLRQTTPFKLTRSVWLARGFDVADRHSTARLQPG